MQIRNSLVGYLIVGLLVFPAVAKGAEWTTYQGEHGTSVPYPQDVFSVRDTRPGMRGVRFNTADGQAELNIFTLKNEHNETPTRFIARVVRDQGYGLTYRRVTDRFLVFSAPEEGRIIYRRCNFPRGPVIHCVDIRYPLAEKRAFDAVVTRISLGLRPR
jgi:hypothetical protein